MRIKSEERRQSILQAAKEIFLQQGFKAASMSEISRIAGGSKATLYSYFPSKEQLFLEVIRSVAGERMQEARAKLVKGVPLYQTLCDFGVTYLVALTTTDLLPLYRIVVGEIAQSGFARQFYEEGPKNSWTEMSDFLEEAMEAGSLRKARPWAAAMHLIALLEAEHIKLLLAGFNEIPDYDAITRSVSDAVAVFLLGYQPGGDPRAICQ